MGNYIVYFRMVTARAACASASSVRERYLRSTHGRRWHRFLVEPQLQKDNFLRVVRTWEEFTKGYTITSELLGLSLSRPFDSPHHKDDERPVRVIGSMAMLPPVKHSTSGGRACRVVNDTFVKTTVPSPTPFRKFHSVFH